MSFRRASVIGNLAALGASLVFALLVSIAAVAAADSEPPVQKATYTTAWAIGQLEYPSTGSGMVNYLTVWTDSLGPGWKLGRFGGEVTKETRVRFGNRPDLQKENLDLLSRRKVFVWGRIRTERRGDVTTQYLEELHIYVLD